MAIIRWSDRPSAWQGFEELDRLQQEMNRLFSSYTGERFGVRLALVFPR